jgi:hypothetical protein
MVACEGEMGDLGFITGVVAVFFTQYVFVVSLFALSLCSLFELYGVFLALWLFSLLA